MEIPSEKTGTEVEKNNVQHRIVTYIHVHVYKIRMFQIVNILNVSGFLSVFSYFTRLIFCHKIIYNSGFLN